MVVVQLEAPYTVHLALSKGSWLRTKRGLCQSRWDTCKSYCPCCFPLSDLFWSLTYLGMIFVIVKIETYHKTLTEKVRTKLTLQRCEDGVQLVTFQFNSKYLWSTCISWGKDVVETQMQNQNLKMHAWPLRAWKRICISFSLWWLSVRSALREEPCSRYNKNPISLRKIMGLKRKPTTSWKANWCGKGFQMWNDLPK